MGITLQLNVTESDYENSGNVDNTPVPTGKYVVTIFDVEAGEVASGPNEGKPRLNFQFRIADGQVSPDGRNQGNRRLFWGINAFKSKSKKTGELLPMFDLISLGKAIGLTVEQINSFDSDEWLGEELEVTVAHEEKKTKESGYKESFNPKEYRAVVKNPKSLKAPSSAPAAKATKATGFKL